MFLLINDRIVRKDRLFEGVDVVGYASNGFIPAKLNDYREYCRKQYVDFREDEIFINPIALLMGMEEPAYDDKTVISPKYHL